ncbi:MAG: hypothetical protein IKY22_00515 [Bacteroidales bacterium]|nr:hypothetical protein [Bacteroidales bacterium]
MIYKTKHKAAILHGICLLLFVCGIGNLHAQKELTEGNKLVRKKHYHEALLAYKKVEPKIDANKHHVMAQCYAKMGECYLGMGYYSVALAHFDKAIKYDSLYVVSLKSYAEALKTNGKYSRLKAVLEEKQSSTTDTSADMAQASVYYDFPLQHSAENKLLSAEVINNIHTLGKKRGLSVISNKMYYSTTSYAIIPEKKDYAEKIMKYDMFSANIENNSIGHFMLEGEISNIEANIVYVTTNPANNNLFFTVLESDNKEYLYECKWENGKWQSANKVKIGKKIIPLSHPTFTADGNIMIFSAKLPNGKGDIDLWYTKQTDKGWSNPVNLGDEVNTKGDEISPFFYNNCLFFSSDGQAENYGGFDIYESNWNNGTPSDVENLYYPYNSFADDFEFIIDPNTGKNFLVSNRDYKVLDDKIYSFAYSPMFTMINGTIYDDYNNPLEGSKITVIEDNIPIYTTTTNKQGMFKAYLRNNKKYTLDISKTNYLSTQKKYSTQTNKTLGNINVSEQIKLSGFEIGKIYKIDDIFHQTASSELLECPELITIETFLKENHHLDFYVFIFEYLTADDTFNELLSNNRISVLTEYFIEQSINENRIHFESYTNEIPTNFGKIDRKKNPSHSIFFLFSPKNADYIKPNTTSVKH